MIPQNTTIFSKEMIKKLEEEQSLVIKELLALDGWFTIFRSAIIGGRIRISQFFRKRKDVLMDEITFFMRKTFLVQESRTIINYTPTL